MRKFILEIDDSDYAELVELYKEFKKNNPMNTDDLTFEMFLSSIIKSNVEAKKQMELMGDKFKTMMDMFGDPSSMNEMMENFFKNMPNQDPNKKPDHEDKKVEEDKKEHHEPNKFKS